MNKSFKKILYIKNYQFFFFITSLVKYIIMLKIFIEFVIGFLFVLLTHTHTSIPQYLLKL